MKIRRLFSNSGNRKAKEIGFVKTLNRKANHTGNRLNNLKRSK